jgi:GNAT superfamily N-acetyltransferase
VVTARRDGVVCGVGGVWVDDNGAHLAVFVPRDERRTGIGRHVVAALESAAARSGWENRIFHAQGPPEFFAAVSARARVYSKATDA